MKVEQQALNYAEEYQERVSMEVNGAKFDLTASNTSTPFTSSYGISWGGPGTATFLSTGHMRGEKDKASAGLTTVPGVVSSLSISNLRTSSGDPRGTTHLVCFDTPASAPTVAVQKTTLGGAGGAFTFTQTNLATAPAAITTTSAGVASPTTPTPIAVMATGAAVTLTETPVAGFALTAASCTDANGATTGNTGQIGTLSGDTLTIPAGAVRAGAAFTCSFTNTRTPTVSVQKTTVGGVGDVFSFTQTNLATAPAAITTTSAGVASPVTPTPIAVMATGAAVTLTETPVAGFALTAASCTDASSATTGNSGAIGALSGNVLTIPAAAVRAGSAFTCSFTNTKLPTVAIRKTTIGGVGGAFSFTPTNLASTPSAITTTTEGVAAPATPTPIAVTATGTAVTLTESPVAGYSLTSAGCTDANAATTGNTGVIGTLSGNTLTLPGTAVRAGAAFTCSFTNTKAADRHWTSGKVFLDNGAGGGTANDGVFNGGEQPLASRTMRLTDCAASVLDSTVTDGTGAYTLDVPGSLAIGANLCVEQSNESNDVSVGASVGTVALPSGVATAVSGTNYRYTRSGSPDRIAFTWNGTGHVGLNFGDVDQSTFAANSSSTGVAGNVVEHVHTFVAGTRGTVSFSIASSVSQPVLSGWDEQIFRDTNCLGKLVAGATQLYPSIGAPAISVAPGDAVCIVVRQYIPATATNGSKNVVDVRAAFDYLGANPALASSHSVTDITLVGDTALQLTKEVRNVTQSVGAFNLNNQAKSGDVLEYRLNYINNSAASIHDLTINDTVPVYSTFVSTALDTTPATLTACTKSTPANPPPAAEVDCASLQGVGGSGSMRWRFVGKLDPAGRGSIVFRVKVD